MIRPTAPTPFATCRCGTAALLAVSLLFWTGPAKCQEVPTAQGSLGLIDKVGIEPRFGEQVPLDLQFFDSTGTRVRLGDYFGERPVILHLVYYECPMLCRLSSDGLLRTIGELSLALGVDYSVVTVSFDPQEGAELSARARTIAGKRCGKEAVDRGWHFLTGDQVDISALCTSVGFRYVYDEQTKQFAHASGVFILTPDGKVSRYLSGVEYVPRDLRLAVVEASAGEVGSANDQVLLMCYMYDPTTGKYGLAVITAVRIGGIAVVGILGASIVFMLHREKTSQQTPWTDDEQ